MLPRTRAPGMRRGRRVPPHRTPGGCAPRAPTRTPEQRSRVAAPRPRPLRRSVRAIADIAQARGSLPAPFRGPPAMPQQNVPIAEALLHQSAGHRRSRGSRSRCLPGSLPCCPASAFVRARTVSPPRRFGRGLEESIQAPARTARHPGGGRVLRAPGLRDPASGLRQHDARATPAGPPRAAAPCRAALTRRCASGRSGAAAVARYSGRDSRTSVVGLTSWPSGIARSHSTSAPGCPSAA